MKLINLNLFKIIFHFVKIIKIELQMILGKEIHFKKIHYLKMFFQESIRWKIRQMIYKEMIILKNSRLLQINHLCIAWVDIMKKNKKGTIKKCNNPKVKNKRNLQINKKIKMFRILNKRNRKEKKKCRDNFY